MNLGFDPIETAKKFMRDGQVGWIDPDGDVHPVALFDHNRFFANHSTAIPELYDFLYSREEGFLQRHSERWRDDHPDHRWHEYVEPLYNPMFDDEDDDLVEVIAKAAYTSGWGRVGAFSNGKLELECTSQHEKALTTKAKHFAELLNREVVVRVNDMEWVNTKDYLPEIFGSAKPKP
jgi:hypothetical protein